MAACVFASRGAICKKVARSEAQEFNCAIWLHKAREMPNGEFKCEAEKGAFGAGDRAVGDSLLQVLQENTSHRGGD